MSASSVTVSVFEYLKLARKRETGRSHTFVGVMDEPNEFKGLLFSSFKQHCHDGLTRSNSDPSSIDWGACSPFQVGKKLCSAVLAACVICSNLLSVSAPVSGAYSFWLLQYPYILRSVLARRFYRQFYILTN